MAAPTIHITLILENSKEGLDEFEKISSENKQKKFVKEQILIVHLGLGFEEAYHPW